MTNKIILYFAILTINLLINLRPARASNSCHDIFFGQIKTSTEQSLVDNNFNVSRNIQDYSNVLLKEPFLAALDNLDRDAIWFDMGAGQARAIQELLNLKKIKKAVALAFKKPISNDLSQSLKKIKIFLII